MYTYKRVIRTPNSIEIEYYKSIKKVGKNYGGRQPKKSKTGSKQKLANQIRTTMKWERMIDCNFCENDYFCRFSAPFGTFDNEEAFMRCVRNWFARIKRRLKPLGIEFKYIGFRECGKLGKNWHLHIILSEEVTKVARKCWEYKNGGINLTPLYANHEYKKLAEYIRKDVQGEKRMMASRNLRKPEIEVREAKKREVKKLERGEMIEPPKGWYQVKDDAQLTVSDVTGASWYFKFRPLAFRNDKNRRF